MADHIEQDLSRARGFLGGERNRAFAELARRHVDDAAQAQLVRRVLHHPEISEHIADFRAAEEIAPLVNAVGYRTAAERALYAVRKYIIAVEDGVIAPFASFFNTIKDGLGDESRFLLLRGSAVEADHFALALFGPEGFALAAAVVADQRVGGVQDIAGRAVILFQPDGDRAGIFLFKFQDIGNGRAAEFINGLVVVTHDTDILAPARKQRAEDILRVVGVLIFVHQHIAEFVLIVSAYLVIVLQQQHGFEDDIVKIERVGVFHHLFVEGVNLRNGVFIVVIRLLLVGFRQNQVVLCAGNLAHHGARVEGLFVQVEPFERFTDSTLFVVVVINGERFVIAQLFDIAAQDAQAGGMEGVRPDSGRVLFAERAHQALLKLLRGLVGEGDRNHFPRPGRIYGTQALGALLLLRLGVKQIAGEESKVLFGGILRGKGAFIALSKT